MWLACQATFVKRAARLEALLRRRLTFHRKVKRGEAEWPQTKKENAKNVAYMSKKTSANLLGVG